MQVFYQTVDAVREEGTIGVELEIKEARTWGLGKRRQRSFIGVRGRSEKDHGVGRARGGDLLSGKPEEEISRVSCA